MSREVNNGCGPVDFKLSHGADDKVLVEVKLSSNPQLEHVREKQLPIYMTQEDTYRAIYLIIDNGHPNKIEKFAKLYNYVLNNFSFENTDFTAFYFGGLVINGDIIKLKRNVYIEKQKTYSLNQVGLTFHYCDDIEYIALILIDLLGNYYLAELGVEQSELELSNTSDSADTTMPHVIKIIDIRPAERQRPSMNDLFSDD